MEEVKQIQGNFLWNTLDHTIAALFGAIMLLTVFQVLCRFILFFPAPWVEELISFLFVWMIFLGSASAQKEREHTRVELIPFDAQSVAAKTIILLGDSLVLLFLLVVVVYGFELSSILMPMPSLVLKIPIGLLYLAAPIGGVFMVVALAASIIQRLKVKGIKR